MNTEQARFNMIEQQIRPWNVLDASVLQLLTRVQRECFVPHAYEALAFADMCLPLPGHDAGDGQGRCMLEPRTEARLLQLAQIQPQHQVLEIGAGSGYMAALLAAQAAQVLSLEIDRDLSDLAQRNLRAQGVHNVEVRHADAAAFSAPGASFDRIVLSGSVPEVPQALLMQLKIGGMLIGIVGHEPMMVASTIVRRADSDFQTLPAWDAYAPALLHFPDPEAFRF